MYWVLFILLILLVFILINVILWTGHTLLYLTIMLFGAPYCGSEDQKLKLMIKLANIKAGERAADLGSGDGRVLIALAKAGAQVHGLEINPLLVRKSRQNIKQAGLEKQITVYHKNFWKQDLSSFDIVIVYGITYMMTKLEKKLLKELKPGVKVISNYYQFPNWEPRQSRGEVHLYVKK